jgi:hypothetical protein
MENTRETEYLERMIAALQKVPEKKLLIIELANSIPVVDGDFDYTKLADKQLEINLAIAEAKAYGTHTIQAVDSLVRLKGQEED